MSNVVKLHIAPRPAEPIDPDDIDRASPILRGAVTYTACQGAFDGGFRADHTDNLVFAGECLADKYGRQRDRALRKLTRLMNKATSIRSVELWGLASVATALTEQEGASSSISLEGDDLEFLKSFLLLIDRDCNSRRREASGWVPPCD